MSKRTYPLVSKRARTILGYLLGLWLVVAFYTRMAREVDRVEASQQQAHRAALRKAERDSTREADEHARTSLMLASQPGRREAGSIEKKAAPFSAAAPAIDQSAANRAVVGEATDPEPALASPASGWQGWLRRYTNWALLLLVGLVVAALLYGASWLWAEQQQQLSKLPLQATDQPVLKELLRAYVEEIGKCSLVPRQVKRFASKARLQNYLVLKAFHLSAATGFTEEAQQVLAFLVLLLLEEDNARVKTAAPAGQQPPSLHKLAEADFLVQAQVRFVTWHQQNSLPASYASFQQTAAQPRLAWADLPTLLASYDGKRLLSYLHHLNTGLLV